jgi:hypothetical protein
MTENNILILLNNKKLYITNSTSYINYSKSYAKNKWLKLYNPIKVIKEFNDSNIEKLTIKYMYNYGIKNVRSDIYPKVDLTDSEISKINKDIEEYNKTKYKESPYMMDKLMCLKYASDDDDSDIFDH